MEARTLVIGRELFRLARREHEHLTTLNRWTKQLLSWCLADPHLKGQVLRFIDVLPTLRTPQAVVRHLHEYFPTTQARLPAALRVGVSLARPGLLTASAATAVVRQIVEQVAHQFIAGSQLDEAAPIVQRLAAQGLLVSFDLLGEQVTSEREADRYARAYLALLATPGLHLSIKPSSLTPHFDPFSFDDSVSRALVRLLPIARRAAEAGAALTLDMEQVEYRDLTLALARRLLQEPGLGERIRLGVVIQAYLADAEPVTAELIQWLTQHHRRLSVRLVKGAYWDYETAHARQRGWPLPVHQEKWRTDQAFERLTRQVLAASSVIRTEIASHNLRSIAHAMAAAEDMGLAKDALEFQLLYGMGDAIQGAVKQLGYPVRVYAPLGELIPGMAYLVRRILENTANESFLRQDLWEHPDPEHLLQAPAAPEAATPKTPVASEPFVSEPFADCSDRRQRERFAQALEEVRRGLGGRHPLLISGESVDTGRWLVSENPAHPDQVVGQVAQAGGAEVERAIHAACQAQRRWAQTSVDERAALMRGAASLLRQRREWFAALEVLEIGKPWREADADVMEAIEYLEYYRVQMLRLASGKPVLQLPGEFNRYLYRPRGVCAVIAPWNFPLAILTGMASAALVTGHCVILKPAEQSPVTAFHLTRLLHDAGFPHDVVQYLPGLGEEVGRALVEHPDVALIMFTGSKAVGLSILAATGRVAPGQRFIKHAVVEMGGKNAIVVDEDADLDAAIKGILTSAFSYQGQKCSACSRLIVHEAVYDRLLERLTGAVDGLLIGDPVSPSCDLGPVIDRDAVQRLAGAIAQGTQSAQLLYRYPEARLPKEGYFVGPALFAGVAPTDRLAQEELFGPVVCAFRVRTFQEGLDLANDVDYGLTGGVYSRSPSHLERAIEHFDVGNLYLNRPITGALVGRQPFGGHKLSGLGTKAGGPDYLSQLLIPKTVCENTTRHGMPLE